MSGTLVLGALSGVGAAVAFGEGVALIWSHRRHRRGRRASRAARVVLMPKAVLLVVRLSGRALTRHGIAAPGSLGARLAAAGTAGRGAAAELMAIKCSLALAAGLACLAGTLGGLGAPLPVSVIAPAAAFVVPDVLVARRSRSRARQLRAQAPELLARVRLAAEAGLGLQRSLELAAGHGGGLLAAELRATLAAIRLGLPREQAFEHLVARCPVPEVHGLVAALGRSAAHGTPLGPAVGVLAARSRADRARRIQDRAQRAAPKIQLVVAVLLVPAVMLLIGAGLLAGIR